MSQEQRRRRQQDQGDQQKDPIKYGDVFQVSGELAEKPVAPQDAVMMQAIETTMFGQTQAGGTAAAMQVAANLNRTAGLVSRQDATVVGDQGINVTATDYPGTRVVTETVGGQVVGQYAQPIPVVQQGTTRIGPVHPQGVVTIGEALEATARTAGDKPVEQSDAAAIQEAEIRATGSDRLTPGGLAAQARSAANINASADREEDKVTLGQVLADACVKLPADKAATREDAEGVFSAEARNNPQLTAHPGGVAASVAAAANLNQQGS